MALTLFEHGNRTVTTLLNLRPLSETDLPRLHGWLNAPHLRPFYMHEAISLEQVKRKFAPRLEGTHACHCLVAAEAGVPLGYAQWYLNRDFPDYGAAMIGKDFGVSIDYFIGETAFLGRRLGSDMLGRLVAEVAPRLNATDRHFFIGHHDVNERAIRCTIRAGFVACGTFVEDAERKTLFVRDNAGTE